MKKIFVILSLISTLSFLPSYASALSGSDFNPGRIIDDVVFFNKDSMTVAQIQDFLSSKVLNCETNHPSTSGDSGTVYSPPFVCLKDFYENPDDKYVINYNYKDVAGNNKSEQRFFYRNNAYEFTSLNPNYKNGNFNEGIVSIRATVKSIAGVKPSGAISAAQIIYNAAQKYNINPQVLLVTLQKEQGLITDTWPVAWQFQAAMGYGCPDSGPCSSQYSGFYSQVENAAWQFRAYTNNPDSYNFKAGVNRYIQFNPSSSCGGSTVYLENQSTANLYNYTPYQPNSAALMNMSGISAGGSVSCGAYGNRNFFWYFTNWFGSTFSSIIKERSNDTLYYLSDNNIFSIESFDTLKEYGLSTNDIKIVDSVQFKSYNYLGRLSQIIKSDNDYDKDGPKVYLVSNGQRYAIKSMDQLRNMGFDESNISVINYSNLLKLKEGDNLKDYLRSPDGFVYKIDNGKKRGFFSYQTFKKDSLDGEFTDLSFGVLSMIPLGQAILEDNTIMKDSSGHFWYVNNGVWSYITTMYAYNCLGLYKLTTYMFKPDQTTSISSNSISSCFVVSQKSGNKYLLDGDKKFVYNPDWAINSFSELSDDVINTKDTNPPVKNIILNNNKALYLISNSKKHYIPNMSTFFAKGYDTNNIVISSNIYNTLEEGSAILSDSQLIDDKGSIYVYYNNYLYYIPSMRYIQEFGFNIFGALPASKIKTDEYNSKSQFTPLFRYNGTIYLKSTEYNFSIASTLEDSFGFSNKPIEVTGSFLGDLGKIRPITRFLKAEKSRDIYLIENGYKRKINSWDKFLEIRGEDSITEVSEPTLLFIPEGLPV